jgi:hypothetical protein
MKCAKNGRFGVFLHIKKGQIWMVLDDFAYTDLLYLFLHSFPIIFIPFLYQFRPFLCQFPPFLYQFRPIPPILTIFHHFPTIFIPISTISHHFSTIFPPFLYQFRPIFTIFPSISAPNPPQTTPTRPPFSTSPYPSALD